MSTGLEKLRAYIYGKKSVGLGLSHALAQCVQEKTLETALAYCQSLLGVEHLARYDRRLSTGGGEVCLLGTDRNQQWRVLLVEQVEEKQNVAQPYLSVLARMQTRFEVPLLEEAPMMAQLPILPYITDRRIGTRRHEDVFVSQITDKGFLVLDHLKFPELRFVTSSHISGPCLNIFPNRWVHAGGTGLSQELTLRVPSSFSHQDWAVDAVVYAMDNDVESVFKAVNRIFQEGHSLRGAHEHRLFPVIEGFCSRFDCALDAVVSKDNRRQDSGSIWNTLNARKAHKKPGFAGVFGTDLQHVAVKDSQGLQRLLNEW